MIQTLGAYDYSAESTIGPAKMAMHHAQDQAEYNRIQLEHGLTGSSGSGYTLALQRGELWRLATTKNKLLNSCGTDLYRDKLRICLARSFLFFIWNTA